MSSTMLRPEASCFVSGNLSHEFAASTRKKLNPTATIFKPSSRLNANAKSFIPTIAAAHLLIDCGGPKESASLSDDEPSKAGSVQVQLAEAFPVSVTRSYVETGQLRRKAGPALEIISLRDFTSECELMLTHKPAGTPYFDGATEYQRQKHKVQQNADRVLYYDWRCRKLCANGSIMTADFSDLTKEAQEAEYDAIPPPIHHFNWLGNPVYSKSDTPPAVSLTVIMSLSRPRGLTFGSTSAQMRKATLFNNAMTFVDPIYYFGGNPDIVLSCKGTELQEVITGDVSKIYSSHGYWNDPAYESYADDEDVPEMDPLDGIYYDNEDLVLNGWFENYGVPTVRTFVEADSSANRKHTLEKKLDLIERIPLQPSRSRLSLVVSRYDLENEDALDVCYASHSSGSLNFTSSAMKSSRETNHSHIFDSKLEVWADESEELSELHAIDSDALACDQLISYQSSLRHEDCGSESPLPAEDRCGESKEVESSKDRDSNSNHERESGNSCLSLTDPATQSNDEYLALLPDESMHEGDAIAKLENLSPVSDSDIEDLLAMDQSTRAQAHVDKREALSIGRPQTPLSNYDSSCSPESPPTTFSSEFIRSPASPLRCIETERCFAQDKARTTRSISLTSPLAQSKEYENLSSSRSKRRAFSSPPSMRNPRQPLGDISQADEWWRLRKTVKTTSTFSNWRVVTPPSVPSIEEVNENEIGSEDLISVYVPPLPQRSPARLLRPRVPFLESYANLDEAGHDAKIMCQTLPSWSSLDYSPDRLVASQLNMSPGMSTEPSTELGSEILLPVPNLPKFTSVGSRSQYRAKNINKKWKPTTTAHFAKFTSSTIPIGKVERIKASFAKLQKGVRSIIKKEMNVLR